MPHLLQLNGRSKMKFTQCKVGLWKLPGLVVEADEDVDEAAWAATQAELDAWAASDQGTGSRMTDTLWSFRTEAQRDWFILKWS